jgi:hypothetical protein
LTEKKQLTRDEEADEIIRRLATHPRKKGRRLDANWTMAQIRDLSSQHGLDLEKEIMEAFSASIAAEIDAEITKTAR